MSRTDRSGTFRIVVCGDEERQGDLFSGLHGDDDADARAHMHEVPWPSTTAQRTLVQVGNRALRLAYRNDKQMALAFDLEVSRTVARRLLNGERPLTLARVDGLPPLKRALVRTFEELLARGVGEDEAVAVVRARRNG